MVITAPKNEKTGRIFNNITATKAVFSLNNFLAEIKNIQEVTMNIITEENLTPNVFTPNISVNNFTIYPIIGG